MYLCLAKIKETNKNEKPMIVRSLLIILLVLFYSCDNDLKLEKEIAKLSVDFTVERFDTAFKNATAKDLPKLKNAYPFLFSKRIPDSVWVNRMSDSIQDILLTEVEKQYPDFKNTEADIKSLFQHLKYYDKGFKEPRVIVLTNDVDYRTKTIVNDSLVLIALDNFLGSDHEFYRSFPKYIRQNMSPSQIIQNITEHYAETYIFPKKRKTFIEEMIYNGKLLYFKDVMLPLTTNAEKIGYAEAQIKWAEANESPIWSYFIEKELLYSTDVKLVNRFISNAPYSKFYLELDNESPGRLGQYIGWQIVKAYADKTGKGIMQVMQENPEELFRQSKFKPKK